MGLFNIIRRMALREKQSIREIKPAHRAVAQHDREVFERWYNRADVHDTGTTEQV